jgi:hypothetical protein
MTQVRGCFTGDGEERAGEASLEMNGHVGGKFARAFRLRAGTIALACIVALAGGAAVPAVVQAKKAQGAVKKGKRPTISGVTEEGQLLTANPGTWRGMPPFTYTYLWESCVKKNCSPIAEATESSYRARAADVGRSLRVLVTAANAGGEAKVDSKGTALVTAGPPVSTGAPVLSGTPAPGEKLEASTGEWAGTAPISYSYQWMTCPMIDECFAIAGATGPSYVVQPLDLASTLEVAVTATNMVGDATTSSAKTASVHAILPHFRELPGIIGKLLDGGLLKALIGQLTGTAPFTYSYRWELCDRSGENCKGIAEALASGLALISDFVGKTLRVVVTASNEAGSTEAVSPPSGPVLPLAPGNVGLPGIIGKLLDGQHLGTQLGAWTGTPPLSYSYQWELCDSSGENCKSIAEALASGLALISDWVGKTLRVAVTASNEAGSSTALSESTTPVAPLAPINRGLPGILGKLLDGQHLGAQVGSWEGTGPLSYSYQWDLCDPSGQNCKGIAEALASGLALISDWVGKTLRVAVTASNEAGSSTALSEPSTPVKALAPGNAEAPSISGNLIDGQLLKALVGAWTGTGPLNYNYQWELCDPAGENCKSIAEALSSGLPLTSNWVGKTLRVAVTAINEAGSSTALSQPTSVVGALVPMNHSLPSITGLLRDGQHLGALVGSWEGTGPIHYAYQWQLCNRSGEECKGIAEALSSGLPLISSWLGRTLRVAVTASNEAGSSTALSEPSTPVQALAPSNTEPPTVSGLLTDGQHLSALTGSWEGTGPLNYSYQWDVCDPSGENCKSIAEALSSGLPLISGWVGKTLRVAVTAGNEAGSATALSPASAPVQALAPIDRGLPSIGGSFTDGQHLSAQVGSWEGTGPLSYSYQWDLCDSSGENCKSIAEALAAGFSLSSGDVGRTLRVAITASNQAGSATALSPASTRVQALAPIDRGLPSIAGTLIDGQHTSAQVGSWEGTGPLSYSYQWDLCDPPGQNCKGIAEALASGLSLSSGFVGKTLRVAVTASNEAGSSTALSEATTKVQALAPGNAEAPTIAGNFVDGQHLSALVGSWTGTGPLNYSYQWQLCNAGGEECKGIAEALASGFGLASGDVGRTLRVAVTASNEAGSATVTSAPTSAVRPLAPSNTGLPSIAGGAFDGRALQALNGNWEGTGPLAYSYQWQLCNGGGGNCAAISEAAAVGLSLISGWIGKTVRVAVTASNEAGAATALSAATSQVEPSPPSGVEAPRTSGTAQDGQVLEAEHGGWSGTAPISYGYQWELCNASGEECANIAEASGSSFRLVSADVGKTVRVAVTATNKAGSATATSTVSAAVIPAPPLNTGIPLIGGVLLVGGTLDAFPGVWAGTTPMTFTYQWEDCGPFGTTCTKIAGAKEPTLLLEPKYYAQTFRVTVTATNVVGSRSARSVITLPVDF